MSIEQDCRETVVFALMKAKAWTKPQAEEYVKLWLDHHPDNAARSQPVGVTMEMVNTLIASVNEAHLSKIEDWRTACWESADRILERIQEAIASAQQPDTGEPVMDVRCEGCGYMTHHREHMGCVRAAKQHTHPAPSVPDGLQWFTVAEHGLPEVGEVVVGGLWYTDPWLKPECATSFMWGQCRVVDTKHRDFKDGKQWLTFGPSHNQITHWARLNPPAMLAAKKEPS